jgi:hypothetical protein
VDLIELLNGLTGGQLLLWAAMAPASAPLSWPPPWSPPSSAASASAPSPSVAALPNLLRRPARSAAAPRQSCGRPHGPAAATPAAATLWTAPPSLRRVGLRSPTGGLGTGRVGAARPVWWVRHAPWVDAVCVGEARL